MSDVSPESANLKPGGRFRSASTESSDFSLSVDLKKDRKERHSNIISYQQSYDFNYKEI